MGMRWRITPRVAATAVVVLACVVAVAVWVQRPAAQRIIPGTEATPVALLSEASSAAEVTVHVAGAVASPGVYTLAQGSRVADAIEVAGGATGDALTGSINLARVVIDGEQVYVPAIGEAAASGSGGTVNLNTADAPTLDRLPGVGEVLAERIVADREAHGPFGSVDDLERVSGIGPAMMASLRDLVVV